jgi:hypothetical protein
MSRKLPTQPPKGKPPGWLGAALANDAALAPPGPRSRPTLPSLKFMQMELFPELQGASVAPLGSGCTDPLGKGPERRQRPSFEAGRGRRGRK